MTTQPMDLPAAPLTSFAYRAQTREGDPLSGTIDASDSAQAKQRLESLHLNVLEIAPRDRPARGAALGAEDFIAFNQQLAYLTKAGLPLEQGLRLIAEDMRHGRLANSIREIAADLESGRSLAESFERHRGRFPTLYSRLLDAGVRSGNLSGMLFNLARHLELTRRLKGLLWRTAAYPIMVLVGLSLVLLFLSIQIVPTFDKIFREFKVDLPALTKAVVAVGLVLPGILIAFLALLAISPVIWWILRRFRLDGPLIDRLVLPMPLIGSVLAKSMLAGWCDALRIGIEAGMDLPAGIALAGETTGSPTLRGDGDALIEQIESGRALDKAPHGKVLPATVVAALAIAAQAHDLPGTLRSLSEMYQQQAEMRLNALPGILGPILLLLLAGLIGLVVIALFLPLLALFHAL